LLGLLSACQTPQKINNCTPCNYPPKPASLEDATQVATYVAKQSRAISFCRSCLSLP
jgi:hypothetical protein